MRSDDGWREKLDGIENNARDRMRDRRQARIELGWDQARSGEWLMIIGIGFLAGGVLCLIAGFTDSLPHTFYQLLRWVVCLSLLAAGVGCLRAVSGQRLRLRDFLSGGLCLALAVLFNPLAPIHLGRAVWLPVDLIAGFLLVVVGPLLMVLGREQVRSAP